MFVFFLTTIITGMLIESRTGLTGESWVFLTHLLICSFTFVKVVENRCYFDRLDCSDYKIIPEYPCSNPAAVDLMYFVVFQAAFNTRRNSVSIIMNCTNCTTNTSQPVSPANSFSMTSCTTLCVSSVAFYVIIIASAVIGNVLVVYAFITDYKIRQSLATYFIVSLAVSDMFTALVVMPFDLELVIVGYTWRHGPLMCSIWTTLYLLMVPTSILNLLALTVDRYKTLSDPLNKFKESPFMTRNKALSIIAGIWVYSLLFALFPEMGWNIYPSVIMNGVCVFNISQVYSMLSSVVNFFVPLVTMCFLYLQIYRIAIRKKEMTDTNGKLLPIASSSGMNLKHTSRKNVKFSSINTKKQKMLLRNTRASKTVLVIVCTFVLCWMPYTIYSFVYAACFTCFTIKGIEILNTVFLVMGYSNSALNPFLFGLTHPLFKKAFKMLFMKLLSKIRHPRQHLPPCRFSNRQPTSHRITRSGSIHMLTLYNISESESIDLQ